jgi:prolyl oligopeptidase PreP (S9A serine peptidase family)
VNKSALSVILMVGLQFNSYANAENSCRGFYLFNRAWLSKQTAKVRAYVKNSQQEKDIEDILLKANQDPRDIAESLETERFTFRVVDQGLGSHTPVEVIMTDKATKKETVLLSSLKLEVLRLKENEKRAEYGPVVKDYRNNNTVLPVDIQLSPLRDILLVKVSSAGSIDGHTLVVIDVKTKKIIQEINNVGSSDAVWISPTQFIFRTHETGLPTFLATVKDNKVTTEPNKLGRFNGSSDQQWVYFRTHEEGLVLQSAVTGQKTRLPYMDIIEILTVEHDTQNVWIKSNGDEGFMALEKVTITPDETRIITVLPEGKTVMDRITVNKDSIQYTSYLGGDRWVTFTDLNGKQLAHVKAPDCCDIASAKYNADTQTINAILQSPVKRRMKWVYDVRTKEWALEDANKVKTNARPNDTMMIEAGERFVTRYDTYRSKDGTIIPIRITYKEGTEKNRNAPALMEVYGGFALNNYFHPSYERMTYEFIRAGGVHITPAVRGSYYYGETWHEQGRGLKKQNVVDDFIAAAEWAIASGITSAEFLAISGASHGGLLVGAAITQRPDLFGLAFPQYGAHAFHDKPTLDPISTPLQKQEYGDLISDPAAQSNARTISPVLRASRQAYPMTVVITGRRDSRVNPKHSYEFYDKLQQNQTGDQPIMLYTQNNSGHWMTSIPRQDFLGWRSRTVFWSVLFKFMKLDIVKEIAAK